MSPPPYSVTLGVKCHRKNFGDTLADHGTNLQRPEAEASSRQKGEGWSRSSRRERAVEGGQQPGKR